MRTDFWDWDLIPQHMHGAMKRYLEKGIAPGDFLSAVLCNDLRRSIEKADETNRNAIVAYVTFLYNYAPHECWGSREKYQAWLDHNGLEGEKK